MPILDGTVETRWGRTVIGALAASMSVCIFLSIIVDEWISENPDLLDRPWGPSEYIRLGKFVPWLFVWLLTIVIVSVQSERNAVLLAIFSAALPATLIGLCGRPWS